VVVACLGCPVTGTPPNVLKVFDEVFTNAMDHAARMRAAAPSQADACPVRDIRVELDGDTGRITVTNSGDGLPVAQHPEHGSQA
jgi:DNA gyrase/topoisomerase IV subunit B